MRKQRNEFCWIESRQQWRKRVKCDDGRYHDVYADTKTECRAAAAALQEEIKRQLKELSERNPYFYQYAAEWYKLNTLNCKKNTREGYANYINNHICPIIGAMKLKDIRRSDVLRVLAAAEGKSKVTQGKILSMTRRILEAAVEDEIINKNPAVKSIKPGGDPTEEKEPLSRAQQKMLLEAVKGTKAETFVMVCLYTGLRREEAMGLKWDKIHLDAVPPYIEVRRAVNWDPHNGAPELVTVLKSDKARRDIPIPPVLADYLSKLKHKAGFLMPNSHGQVMSKQSFRRMWECVTVRTADEGHPLGSKTKNHKIVRTLDFHVTPHLLRHTYISELILSGANIKTVQYLAGHASVTITLRIYTHLMDNRPSDTVGAVTGAFCDASGSVRGQAEEAQSQAQ